jgi:hypothetical protein
MQMSQPLSRSHVNDKSGTFLSGSPDKPMRRPRTTMRNRLKSPVMQIRSRWKTIRKTIRRMIRLRNLQQPMERWPGRPERPVRLYRQPNSSISMKFQSSRSLLELVNLLSSSQVVK